MHKLALFSSLSLLSALAAAQSDPQQITVTGRINASTLDVGGFGDTPLERSPFAASLLTASQLQDAGARDISDLTRLDAAISDAYNAEGYWQALTVRGFAIDNRFNYRRDGLPINAETAIPLDNKSALEVLKGTSGIQAGTSAPGGLVDFVVKRPTRNLRSAAIEWREPGSVAVSTDMSQRFGSEEMVGLRVNAAYEHLEPAVRNTRGSRHVVAAAGDWRITPDMLLEAEVESSRHSQPSVPGFSLLGNTLPDARSVDPRINLNNQPWSQPVVFDANTGSLRLQQRLGDDWRLKAHAMTQHLTTQDRVAFPFGCSAENVFDRFCSDGTFDLYDYRSENEHRRSDALDLSLAGSVTSGPIRHQITGGVLYTRFKMRSQGQAYNWVGVGRIDGSAVVPSDPTLAYPNTDRDERSTEWYLRDAMQLSPDWGLWAGLRHSRLRRESIGTDGNEPVGYAQSFTTPWVALTYQLAQRTMAYASWGQGVESEVVPNLPDVYVNAGQPLRALKSRQAEIGVKHGGASVDASAALFDIDRPATADLCSADTPPCTRVIDGSARHRGAELLLSWHGGPWQLHGSAMWLDAERRNAVEEAALNGMRPTNVAARTMRLQAVHQPATLPGLSLMASLVYEGNRMVLPDNSVHIPGWTRFDLGARYAQPMGNTSLTWRIGLDNVTDKRAWKEAPYQYGHAYLFPMAPRTWRVALQADI